jgi:hypothetical protein
MLEVFSWEMLLILFLTVASVFCFATKKKAFKLKKTKLFDNAESEKAKREIGQLQRLLAEVIYWLEFFSEVFFLFFWCVRVCEALESIDKLAQRL